MLGRRAAWAGGHSRWTRCQHESAFDFCLTVPSAVSSEAVVIRFFVTGSAMRAVDLWCHRKATEAGSSGRDLAQKCFVGLELRLRRFERRSY